MKEKVLSVLGKLKEHKKSLIIVAVALVVLIVLITIISNANKPKKYEDKIKTLAKALSSESKMKTAISKTIDTRASAAWIEADLKAKDFNKEYKSMKKDSDEVEDLEKALKKFAENSESLEREYKISKIKKPVKNSDNGKIYTCSAKMTAGSEENDVKIVFYKGKIIDITLKTGSKTTSLFETIIKSN